EDRVAVRAKIVEGLRRGVEDVVTKRRRDRVAPAERQVCEGEVAVSVSRRRGGLRAGERDVDFGDAVVVRVADATADRVEQWRAHEGRPLVCAEVAERLRRAGERVVIAR